MYVRVAAGKGGERLFICPKFRELFMAGGIAHVTSFICIKLIPENAVQIESRDRTNQYLAMGSMIFSSLPRYIYIYMDRQDQTGRQIDRQTDILIDR